MPEAGTERVSARPGRCQNHPGVVRAATCVRCGRSLCVTCAVPVRGSVYGPECLPEILEDVPARPKPPPIRLPRGDVLAAAGFAGITALSVRPWSRFGDASGALQAWTLHWSLLAVAAGVLGLAAAVAFSRRPRDPRVEIATYLGLALLAAAGAYLHYRHPPPLSSRSVVPLIALASSGLVVLAAALKAAAMLRARWHRP